MRACVCVEHQNYTKNISQAPHVYIDTAMVLPI